VPAQFDVSPARLIERSLLDRVAAIVADDLALTDEATGSTFLGPEGLLLWLQASAADSLDAASRGVIRFAEIVEFRDGKIAHMRAFRDTTRFLHETGLVSRAETYT
jgi:hypothetical protein